MVRLTVIWQCAIIFTTFLSIALAASPTSFCKCTCFSNSTIIPLDEPASSKKPVLDDEEIAPARTCADCNKQFCLSYNLPICKDAEEDDVFTTCFQRDSTKDQVVIYVFVSTTVGLLGWAMLKPVVEKWRERTQYVPVAAVGQ